MRVLFYDTETSGLPLFNEPSEDPRQPHIVQAAAVLVDVTESGAVSEPIATIDLIARAEGWEIPEDVAKIHGITTERSRQDGISEHLLLDVLHDLWSRADLRVAHNESFDARIVRIAMKRYQMTDELADAWKAGKAECTGRLSTPILKMTPTEAMRAAGRNYPKMPKLTEAYAYFFGAPLVGAHSAMVDAQACMRIWFEIRKLQRAAA